MNKKRIIKRKVKALKKSINFNEYDIFIKELLKIIQKGELQFQFNHRKWSTKRKQNLINSIILGAPMPSIVINKETQTIIDGANRLQAIIDFFNNKFPINNLGEEIDGAFFKDLPKSLQKSIKLREMKTISITYSDIDLDDVMKLLH